MAKCIVVVSFRQFIQFSTCKRVTSDSFFFYDTVYVEFALPLFLMEKILLGECYSLSEKVAKALEPENRNELRRFGVATIL